MEGEEGEEGSGSVGCQQQEGLAVGFFVLEGGAGAVGHCSASAGAVACSRVTILGEEVEEGEEEEEEWSLDSAHCGEEAATTSGTQKGKGTWT